MQGNDLRGLKACHYHIKITQLSPSPSLASAGSAKMYLVKFSLHAGVNKKSKLSLTSPIFFHAL